MIRRSTLLILSSLTSVAVVAGTAAPRATAQQHSAASSEPGSALLIAQQNPQTEAPQTETPPTQPPQTAPAASPDPFSINPANSTNTGTTVPSITSPQARPTADALQSSQQTESVRALQQQLQQRGYYDGPVDGLYGSGTQQAIQSFQQDTGLPSTGEVDIPTLQQLSPDGPVSQTGSPAADSSEAPNTEGADTADDTPAPEEPVESEDSPVAAGESGLGKWLWPGIALIAALGSFGIGFALFNRGKDEDLILENDTPWGTVSPDLHPPTASTSSSAPPTSNPVASVPEASYVPASGQNGRNGQSGSQNGSAGIASALSNTAQPIETTRLAKVNILDELVEDLRVPDPARRRKAIWELGQRGNSTAVQPLVNAMVGADSKEKSLILAALSEIGIRSLKPMNRALAIALQDDNPEVRKNAIRDLTRIYDLVAQISQMLGHATEDEDPEVRQTANWALEQLGRIRKLPEVKHSLPTLEPQPHPAELLPGDRSN